MTKFLPLLAAVFLCGCAGLSTPQLERPAYLKVLASKKIDAGTYARISHGRVLGHDDIKALVVKGVPGSMIVPYLRATRTPYKYSASEINALVNAGADDTLVNYLGKAAGIYMQDSGDIPRSHPYYTNPYYMGPAPFDFAYPAEWSDYVGFY